MMFVAVEVAAGPWTSSASWPWLRGERGEGEGNGRVVVRLSHFCLPFSRATSYPC